MVECDRPEISYYNTCTYISLCIYQVFIVSLSCKSWLYSLFVFAPVVVLVLAFYFVFVTDFFIVFVLVIDFVLVVDFVNFVLVVVIVLALYFVLVSDFIIVFLNFVLVIDLAFFLLLFCL